MRICQVTPGLIPIPPNGWGAVEKIIWMYHLKSIELGHDSEIKYLDDVDSTFDIVHIHVANLAVMAHQRGIKYVFSLHDHHAFLYGKDSDVYKENMLAIEHSEISFVPAKFLIPYFDNHPKLKYFSHGVDTNFFVPGDIELTQHKLLCVANNGYANNQNSDRKGFSYAINAAKILNLPITIAGPENNKNYFDNHNIDYDKLTILYNLSEDQLLKTYQSHTIFLHPSELEAGHPNLTLLEAMSCGLPVVGTYEVNNELPGMYRVNRNVSDIIDGINDITKNYPTYNKLSLLTAKKHSFTNVTLDLIDYYKIIIHNKNEMREKLINIYENTEITNNHILQKPIRKNQIIYTFIDNAKVEIIGDEKKEYKIEFIDSDNNKLIHVHTIGNNCWTMTYKSYHINWLINVYHNNHLIDSHRFNPTNKHVYISHESSAIGDTLAWFPIFEEYRKKWNCVLTVSTYHNEWFETQYPNINFVVPGTVVNNLYAMFKVGWFYNGNNIDYNKNRSDFRLLPLQQTATDILNLDPIEVKPKINITKYNTNIPGDYVVIAPHASAHAKYWNNPNGWQDVINHINSIGYKVVMITKEKLGDKWEDSKIGCNLKNVIDKTGDLPIEDRVADILNCKLFIGVGSGLSWLSWALNTKTMLISGFSEPYSEFNDCVRIYNNDTNLCSGCFNKHKLDSGDWDWCPNHKNTTRMFECSKSISSKYVIDEIDKILK